MSSLQDKKIEDCSKLKAAANNKFKGIIMTMYNSSTTTRFSELKLQNGL